MSAVSVSAPRRRQTGLLVAFLLVVASVASAVSLATAGRAATPKTPPMTTPWTAAATAAIGSPLPDYPRPQMTRSEWQSLNGEWEFGNAAAGQSPPVNQTLGERVNVPYPIESALSGIQRHQDRMWYRRTFTVPTTWNGRRTILNFGAVDQQATVYINGANFGTHNGGYDGFQHDITGSVRAGSNEIIVGVFDPTDAGTGAVGKQRNSPGGIMYTPTSGIWQTVWIEPANFARITRLDMTPDVPGQALNVVVRGAGIGGQGVQVTAFLPNGGASVGSGTGTIDGNIRVAVPNPHLWNPEDPFLYDVRVTLTGTGGGDAVSGYFGMRSIGLASINGVTRIALNGNFVFQTGMLDQGFWPDGLYTAPTDDALKFDIQKQKDFGFNMIRKHIKVEPARWFYWADRLGMLVWQDMPAMANVPPVGAPRTQWELEFREMVDEHRSSPAVIMWVDQNEGWGQYDQARIATLVKSWDPSRLVNNMSGVNCCGAVDGGNGDVKDWHYYVGPESPGSSARAAVLGEYGGLSIRIAGHEWSPGNGFGYEDQPNTTALTNRYLGLVKSTKGLMVYKGLNAAVYTEPTDVENEVNGFMTYDRQIIKVDQNAVRAANLDLIAASRNLGAQQVGMPVNQNRSIQVTTPGFTNRFVRHQNALGFTSVIDGASSPGDKADATFTIRPGLANGACTSFESRNFPGRFLRHAASRVSNDQNDNSALFAGDATFCAIPGNSGTGVSFMSWNYPMKFLRHINAEVWIAQDGGGITPAVQDNQSSYMQDTSWNVAAPWAP